jgi:cation transport protein ChaC
MDIRISASTSIQPRAETSGAADPLASLPAGDLWVFAYGSLMWNPGFAHAQARLARIHGYHRSMCVWSWVHRGTEARPGLVLGLDRGGSCVGVAHRVVASERDAAVAYLYERELVTHVYKPVVGRLRVDDVGIVPALTFVVDRRHAQYAGKLSPAEAAKTIRGARGRSGPNPDYFANTIVHMEALGIRCPRLHAIQRALKEMGTQKMGTDLFFPKEK